MQFVILQGSLCRYQLIFVGADLRFQLGEVAPGDASRCKQGACPFAFRPADVEGCFIYLDGFGCIENLYVNLRNALFDGVLAFRHAQFGNAVVHPLLFQGIQPFAAVVKRPVGIDTIAAVVAGLALAAGDVVAVYYRIGLAVGPVYDTLAYGCREAGEEGCPGGLYVHFGALGVETVLAYRDVLLQSIVDAGLQVPLCGKRLRAVLLLRTDSGFLRLRHCVADTGACRTERYYGQSFYIYHITLFLWFYHCKSMRSLLKRQKQ